MICNKKSSCISRSDDGVDRKKILVIFFNFWRQNYFFNFSTPVYKMWIIQEPNKLDLWNKLHFEEEKTESI